MLLSRSTIFNSNTAKVSGWYGVWYGKSHITFSSCFPFIFIGNTAILDPIVNLTGISHPGEICKRLDDEKKNSETNEGLYSRFLICMPEPVFAFADDVESIREDLPSFARYIRILLYFDTMVWL